MRSWDESGGCPVYWPGGVRHRGGVSLFCGSCMELGKAGSDTSASLRGGERESAKRQKS